MRHEGYDVARWLNSIGVAAIVVKYRVSNDPAYGYQHPIPLMDAQRAIRLTRSRGAGVGHRSGTHRCPWVFRRRAPGLDYGHAVRQQADGARPRRDRPHCRAARTSWSSIYPVISTTKPFGHAGSKPISSAQIQIRDLARLFSSELNVTDTDAAIFLVHSHDDPVSSENSVYFYLALKTPRCLPNSTSTNLAATGTGLERMAIRHLLGQHVVKNGCAPADCSKRAIPPKESPRNSSLS